MPGLAAPGARSGPRGSALGSAPSPQTGESGRRGAPASLVRGDLPGCASRAAQARPRWLSLPLRLPPSPPGAQFAPIPAAPPAARTKLRPLSCESPTSRSHTRRQRRGLSAAPLPLLMPQARNRLKPVQTGRFHLGLVFSPWRRGAFGNLGGPAHPPLPLAPGCAAAKATGALIGQTGCQSDARLGWAGGASGGGGGEQRGPAPSPAALCALRGGAPLSDRPSRAVTQTGPAPMFAKRGRRPGRALIGRRRWRCDARA